MIVLHKKTDLCFCVNLQVSKEWIKSQRGKVVTDVCLFYMGRCMGKPTICIFENKDADQLRSNCEADQHLCFRYTDSIIPLLKSEISSF